MKTNQDYKNAALDRLRGHWGPAVTATLICTLIAMLCSGNEFLPAAMRLGQGTQALLAGACSLLSVFVMLPLQTGYDNAVRLMYERRDYALSGNMVSLALSGYLHKVAGMLLMGVKLFLWMLLLFIPGLIMSYAYALTPYILDEHPEIGAWEASTRSREMMRGHKFDLFYLHLSFLGWILLSLLTFGIGLLWTIPYMKAAQVAFYNDIKAAYGEPAALV